MLAHLGHLDEVCGLAVTAIVTDGHYVTVRSEAGLRGINIICTNATIGTLSIDCISVLRLSAKERSIVCACVIELDSESVLFLLLGCGGYLIIRAKRIGLERYAQNGAAAETVEQHQTSCKECRS